MKNIIILSALLLLYNCRVCNKTIGRTKVEISKEDLVCQCKNLKKDSLLAKKLILINCDLSRYLLGKVLVKATKKGLYQYVKISPQTSVNNYIYYDGISIYRIDSTNLNVFSDSLYKLGFKKKKIHKTISLIQKNLKKKTNNSDVF